MYFRGKCCLISLDHNSLLLFEKVICEGTKVKTVAPITVETIFVLLSLVSDCLQVAPEYRIFLPTSKVGGNKMGFPWAVHEVQ